jgi:L-lactate utilization protein LutC
MSARDDFLARVRRAVSEGNRHGGAPAAPQRGAVGYQGAGPGPAARFAAELAAAGGVCHRVGDAAAAVAVVVELARGKRARRALLGDGLPQRLGLAAALREAGIEVRDAAAAARDALFAADVGVSGVDALVAETGSVVLHTRPGQPRAVSLLPPLHVAVAAAAQLLPDLFDLFEEGALPSCLQIITGPSKTGDIELKLVTGVHGPGELHVVLIDDAPPG